MSEAPIDLKLGTLWMCLGCCVLLLSSCGSVSDDFRGLCAIAQRVEKTSSASALEQPRETIELWRETNPGGKAQAVVNTMAGAALEKKYEYLQRAVRKHGIENYRCEALKRILIEASKANRP